MERESSSKAILSSPSLTLHPETLSKETVRRESHPAKACSSISFTPAEIFTDWKEMLDAVKPDVVHICTPHDLHAEMACECLARGINVYLEKPIAISEEELCRIEEAAKNSEISVSRSLSGGAADDTQGAFGRGETNQNRRMEP